MTKMNIRELGYECGPHGELVYYVTTSTGERVLPIHGVNGRDATEDEKARTNGVLDTLEVVLSIVDTHSH